MANTTLKGIEPEKFRNTITELMHQWSPDDQRADYVCAFCHNRPPHNYGDINHEKDCTGQQLLAAIDED